MNEVQIKRVTDIWELEKFLKKIDYDFPVALSQKVDLKAYAKKVMEKGTNFFAMRHNEIIGVCTGYTNDEKDYKAYISILAVLPQYRNLTVGQKLIRTFKEYSEKANMKKIQLYVHKKNDIAIRFYKKNGFEIINQKANYDYSLTMEYNISKPTNILLTSVGRRGYLVQYFKEALEKAGEIFVANSTNLSPAFNYTTNTVITPLIYDDNYISFLLDYCKENKIKAIISLFDVDLAILSKNKKMFEEYGIRVIVSEQDVIEICNDKWKTYKFLKENGFNTINTYINLEDAIKDLDEHKINYPVIVKPRWGMGSISVMEAENEYELKAFYNMTLRKIGQTYLKYESNQEMNKAVLIQEKINGQEYGLDVINDLNGNYQNTIVKEKYAMRAGETDCAKVVKSSELKELGEKISKKLKHIANMDIDVFLVNNKPYVLEMNARFGGGYPFSHMSGVNLPKAIILWLKGEKIDKQILEEKKFNKLFHKDINIVELRNN